MYNDLIVNKIDYKTLINGSTILIGGSRTGKSYIIRDILYNIKELIPVCLVICPTEMQNEGYKDIVPDVAIIKTVTRDRLISKMSKLYQRQEQITKTYNMANDANKLRAIVQQIEGMNDKINKIEEVYEKCKQKLQESKQQLSGSPSDQVLIQKIEKLTEQNKIVKLKLRKQYKKSIENKLKNQTDISSYNLSPDQLIIVKNLHLNPNILLVLDDIAANLDTQLQRSELFRKFFFQGRHNNITLLIAVQDDKKLIPEIRQNGFNLVFTDSNSLCSYVKSNNGSLQSIKQIVQTLNLHKDEFIKILYSRELNQYHFIKARAYPDFKFGSDKFWDFCIQTTKNK